MERFRESSMTQVGDISTGSVGLQQGLAGKLREFGQRQAGILRESVVTQAAEQGVAEGLEQTGEKREVGVLGTAASQAFNQALSKGYEASIKADARRKISEYALIHPDDVHAFKKKADTYLEATINNAFPELQAGLKFDLGNVASDVGLKVQANQLKKHADEALAAQIDLAELTKNAAIEGAAAGVPIGQNREYFTFVSQIDAADIPETKKAEIKRAMMFDMNEGSLMGETDRLLGEKPTIESATNAMENLKVFRETTIPDMDTVERDALANKMESRIRAAMAGAQGENQAIGNMVKETIKTLESGRNARGVEDLLNNPLVTPEQRQELAKAQVIKDTVDAHMKMPIIEQQRRLAELEQRADTGEGITPFERDMMDAMAKASNNLAGTLNSDPLQAGYDSGIVRVQEPLNPAAPAEDIIANLDARFVAAQTMQATHGVDSPMLTKQETELFSVTFSTLDPQQKAAFVQQLNQSPHAMKFYEDMSKAAPVMALAGSVANNGYTAGSALIFQGQEWRGVKDNGLPKEAEIRAAVVAEIGTAYVDSGVMNDAMVESAVNVYAALSQGARDISEVVTDDRVRQAIAAISPGVVTYNGTQIEAPFNGADTDDFEDLVAGYSLGDLRLVWPDADERSLNAVKNYGVFRSRGSGRYAVELNGMPLISPDNGMPVIIDMRGQIGKRAMSGAIIQPPQVNIQEREFKGLGAL